MIFIGRINYKYYMEDLFMSKYYSINKFSKILGVSAQTLRNWDKKGKLHPHHTSSNGYRYYSHEQLNQVMNVKPNLDRIVIGYCRVSSNKQKDDLERQIENMKLYLTAQGKPFEIISDIGSGINYKKKGLKELMKRISQNKVDKVVVFYKDRLLRFGFELVEYIASLYDCDIEIIDHTEKTEQQELVEDLVQIITVFSCKLQGKRANKARKLVKELIDDGGEEDDKTIRVMLIPNNKQNTKLFRYANTARFAYNWALGREKENYKNGGKFLSDSDLRKEFTQLKKTEEYSWLNEVSNNVTKQAIKDACHAYKRFFKGCSKFPKFKSRKFSIPSFYQDNVKIQFSDTHVKIEGFAASKKEE